MALSLNTTRAVSVLFFWYHLLQRRRRPRDEAQAKHEVSRYRPCLYHNQSTRLTPRNARTGSHFQHSAFDPLDLQATCSPRRRGARVPAASRFRQRVALPPHFSIRSIATLSDNALVHQHVQRSAYVVISDVGVARAFPQFHRYITCVESLTPQILDNRNQFLWGARVPRSHRKLDARDAREAW